MKNNLHSLKFKNFLQKNEEQNQNASNKKNKPKKLKIKDLMKSPIPYCFLASCCLTAGAISLCVLNQDIKGKMDVEKKRIVIPLENDEEFENHTKNILEEYKKRGNVKFLPNYEQKQDYLNSIDYKYDYMIDKDMVSDDDKRIVDEIQKELDSKTTATAIVALLAASTLMPAIGGVLYKGLTDN